MQCSCPTFRRVLCVVLSSMRTSEFRLFDVRKLLLHSVLEHMRFVVLAAWTPKIEAGLCLAWSKGGTSCLTALLSFEVCMLTFFVLLFFFLFFYSLTKKQANIGYISTVLIVFYQKKKTFRTKKTFKTKKMVRKNRFHALCYICLLFRQRVEE